MKLKYLQTFFAVAQHGSFSNAARALYTSQPSVSLQIRTLEELYGCRLIDRTGRKITLTPAGHILYKHAKAILKICTKAEQEILKTMNQEKGNLHLGVSMSLGGDYLTIFLKQFITQFPQVNITMTVTNTRPVINGIKNNDFDIGLVEGKIEGCDDLAIKVFAEDEMIIAALSGSVIDRKASVIDGKKYIEVGDLINYPMVLRKKESGTRALVDNAIKNAGINFESLKVIIELGSTEAVKGAVEEGIGISILSRCTVTKEVLRGIFSEIYFKDLTIKRTFKLIYNPNKFQSNAFEIFVNELVSYFYSSRSLVIATIAE